MLPRAEDALGLTAGEGPTVLEVDTDGQHRRIDRSFKLLPEFRSTFDFDDLIAESLATPAAPIWRPG